MEWVVSNLLYLCESLPFTDFIKRCTGTHYCNILFLLHTPIFLRNNDVLVSSFSEKCLLALLINKQTKVSYKYYFSPHHLFLLIISISCRFINFLSLLYFHWTYNKNVNYKEILYSKIIMIFFLSHNPILTFFNAHTKYQSIFQPLRGS